MSGNTVRNKEALMRNRPYMMLLGAQLFTDSLWQIYIILVLKGMMAVLFSPAKSGKVKELVPSSQMNQAVSISSGIEQITKIIGPALGGVLVTLIGIKFCFVTACRTTLD
ncbi:MFS transporter [Paenibacillus dokdonensis]|uniref:MFS transporter n=1 Tax=Paenibacillus dokdonensis TaxID=2567944 RepID=UPI0010A943D0|nr:MFS transporter [Paenibacillus dokdonensis]